MRYLVLRTEDSKHLIALIYLSHCINFTYWQERSEITCPRPLLSQFTPTYIIERSVMPQTYLLQVPSRAVGGEMCRKGGRHDEN